MKFIGISISLVLIHTLANCQESHPAKFTIRLKDDAGSPIADYMVHTGSTFDFKTAALPPDNMIHTSVRDDMNYYVRIRTMKDAEGRIVSCNYAKSMVTSSLTRGGRGGSISPTPLW